MGKLPNGERIVQKNGDLGHARDTEGGRTKHCSTDVNEVVAKSREGYYGVGEVHLGAVQEKDLKRDGVKVLKVLEKAPVYGQDRRSAAAGKEGCP